MTQKETDDAFLYSVRHKNRLKTEELLKAGADVNVLDEHGETALMQACLNNDADMVKLLVKYRADPNVLDDNDDTPFFMHAEKIT